VLLWLIPTIVAVWTSVALVVVSLCAAAAAGDRHLAPEREAAEPRFLRAS
jgi:hypothetical protein